MIAACHARAASWEATDWARIIALYDRLGDLTPSPVVALNRAAAIGMAHGAEAGLAALDALDSDALKGYRFLPSTRGDFLRRLERWGEAAACYREALGMVENASERRFLTGRLEECERILPRKNQTLGQ
jgi:RNA polymerase sigma-70 factor (ECF subfamily)